ncbi:hypothetical protein TSAR_013994, partial [Trichomalopsis sarcophagae]
AQHHKQSGRKPEKGFPCGPQRRGLQRRFSNRKRRPAESSTTSICARTKAIKIKGSWRYLEQETSRQAVQGKGSVNERVCMHVIYLNL